LRRPPIRARAGRGEASRATRSLFWLGRSKRGAPLPNTAAGPVGLAHGPPAETSVTPRLELSDASHHRFPTLPGHGGRVGRAIPRVGGVAAASIPDPSGVVHVCYQKSGGGLRIVDTPSVARSGRCRKGERATSWTRRAASAVPAGSRVAGRGRHPGVEGTQGSPGSRVFKGRWAPPAAKAPPEGT